MLKSSPPPRFPIPFASGAGGGFIRPIPQASQIGINPGFASLTDGFPPLNGQPVASGGIPPFEQDMNGILNQISLWCQWHEAGAPIFYDATFATGGSGGYPQGAVVMSAIVQGNYWLNTLDGNTTDPDSSSAANWINPPGLMGTGWLGYTVFSTLPAGWVWAKNNYSIGSVASGSSYSAANAVFLYAALWNAFPNSQCPVLNSGSSGGAPTTRGANAAADFAANKQLLVLDVSGTGIIGADNVTGRLTGVPVISGNPNAPGALMGENLHALIAAELAAHTHNGSGTTGSENANHSHAMAGAAFVVGTTTASAATPGGATGIFGPTAIGPNTGVESVPHQHLYSFTTDGGNGISNAVHNTVQRSMTVNWMLKL